MAGGLGFGGMMHGAGGARGGLSEDERVDGKIYDFKLIKKMSRFAKPYLHLFLAALILILAVSSSRLARPYITKIAIDEYMSKRPFRGITHGLSPKRTLYPWGAFFGLVVMEFAFSYLHTYILNLAGKKIVMNLRDRIFRHIQKLPVSYFDKNPVGKIVTRVTNDTDSLNEMFTNVIVSLMQDIFVMIGVVAIMLSLSVRLTIISFLVLPVMTLATYVQEKAREIFQEIRARLANLNAFLAEHVSGMKLIQVFNMQDKKCDEFEKTNKEYYDSNRKRIILHGLFRPFMDVVNSLAIALILWFGGRDIISGILEFGTLYAFTNYINQFFQPIMNLTEIYNTMQSSMVSAERIFDLLEEKPEPEPEDDDTIELKEIRGEIEFKNVWFAYVGENWVLKDVSFKINPGETAAFVGATGAGKTSIINLICGFYEIQKGDIFIDGINLKKIKKTALRKNIGLVLQDVFLFSGDIETNIKLFEEGITFDKVKKAAEYVNADYFISRFPEGYKHPVNEKGTTLSAGQRQLLSFARALVFDPAILVLDEATSNIDTETEILIQKALVKLLSGRTSIAIAHRLSTIQKADKILVIHKGTIRESGSHQELLEKKGLYYNLYKLQYDGEDIDTIMNEIA